MCSLAVLAEKVAAATKPSMLYSHAGIFSEMAQAAQPNFLSLGVTMISMVGTHL